MHEIEGSHFLCFINIHKVAEEIQMAYLADFYVLHLGHKSDFCCKTWYTDSWRVVKPDYAKTQFPHVGLMYAF